MLFRIFSFFIIVGCSACRPSVLESALERAGENRIELERVLRHYSEEDKDSLKWEAARFLIENMPGHLSIGGDSIGPYYAALNAVFSNDTLRNWQDSLDKIHEYYKSGLRVQEDIKVIKSGFLIANIDSAFRVWREKPWASHVGFDDFCEYILPYRITTEPITDWRVKYHTQFQWLGDSICNKSLKNILSYATIDYKDWFTFTTGKEYRDEPLPRLSAQQLLFRKKGPCEDVASLETFIFRSQAIPAAYVTIPFWATSAGAHFSNTIFEKNMNPIKFDITMNMPVNHELPREPAKVIRHTYSKQKETLAMYERKENIPPGYMQHLNYIDVTHEYWDISNVTVPLFTDTVQIVYAGIFSRSEWNAEWWGRQHCDSVTFSNMPKGIVILPMTYNKGKFKVAGYPIVNGFNHQLLLIPDTVHTRSVIITEQDKYLQFRSGKKYELFYWNNRWKSLGVQTATVESSVLLFTHVPRNVLMLLIPEYSEGKERPFIVMDDGSRYWW